ncbi:hypothetical protein [Paenibacillus xylanexedens]|nr:hypothetical protein [Paenibacillus xylanexedens]
MPNYRSVSSRLCHIFVPSQEAYSQAYRLSQEIVTQTQYGGKAVRSY